MTRVYLKKYELAIEDSTRAIAIDPGYAFSYVTRAQGKDGLGDPAGALDDYNLAESIDPANMDIYAERCQLHLTLGNVAEALADANTLIEMAPESARGYLRRAEVYLDSEFWDKALEDLARCELLEPDDETTWRLRGTAYYFSHRLEQAAEAFDTASMLNPEEHVNYLYRAQALVHLERRHEAIAMLTRWISTAKPTEMGYLRRGAVYQEINEPSLALADYRAAAEINPALKGYADLWSAIVLREQGDAANATLLLGQLADNHASWEARLAGYLLGRPMNQALYEYAATDEQRAEAYYYTGIRAQWVDEHAAARVAFEECLATANHDLFEREFSRARLRALAVDNAAEHRRVEN